MTGFFQMSFGDTSAFLALTSQKISALKRIYFIWIVKGGIIYKQAKQFKKLMF